jgi:acyl carrier protein
MPRDEVLDSVRSHLADELEVDPERITEGTRLREDLEADSLDLFTLVQELDDTHGVVLPDDEASKITTVGEAADAVLRHLPAGR